MAGWGDNIGETTKYYEFGGRRIAMRTTTSAGASTLYYLANDHLGGTAMVMDASGAVVSRTRYLPFGQPWTQTGGAPQTDKLFTGHEVMGYNSGLYYAGARYYSADLGRFLSADPLVPNAGNPQLLNRYAYAGNNPLRFTDPTGLRLEDGWTGYGREDCPRPCGPWSGAAQAQYTQAVAAVGQPDPVSPDPGSYCFFARGNCASQHVQWLSDTIWAAEYFQRAGRDLDSIPWSAAQRRNLWDAVRFGVRPWIGDRELLEDAAAFAVAIGGVASGPTIRFSSGGPTAGRDFSLRTKFDVFDADPTRTCVDCGREGAASQVDHGVPRSRGGNATLENANLACSWCNQSKGAGLVPRNPPPGFEGRWPPVWWPDWLR